MLDGIDKRLGEPGHLVDDLSIVHPLPTHPVAEGRLCEQDLEHVAIALRPPPLLEVGDAINLGMAIAHAEAAAISTHLPGPGTARDWMTGGLETD